MFKYRDTAKVLNNFTNLQYGKVYPTDIDAFIEFGNKVFVLIEGKQDNVEFCGGQKYALERLCDKCHSSESKSLLIVSNNRYLPNNDVDMGNSIVREYRFKQKWYKSNSNITVKALIDKFLNTYLKP
jgi:hypothetical protein